MGGEDQPRRRLAKTGNRVGAQSPNHLVPEPTNQHPLGTVLGLAGGDAVGTTVEFRPPGTSPPVTDWVGRGPFGLRATCRTGTSRSTISRATIRCSCRSRAIDSSVPGASGCVEPGHEGGPPVAAPSMAAAGMCLFIPAGIWVFGYSLERTADVIAGSTDDWSAGNGSLMRLARIPMFFARAPREAIAQAALSSRTTHGATAAVAGDACRYLAALIVGAVHGASRDTLLAPRFTPVQGLWDAEPLHPVIDAIAADSLHDKAPPATRGSAITPMEMIEGLAEPIGNAGTRSGAGRATPPSHLPLIRAHAPEPRSSPQVERPHPRRPAWVHRQQLHAEQAPWPHGELRGRRTPGGRVGKHQHQLQPRRVLPHDHQSAQCSKQCAQRIGVGGIHRLEMGHGDLAMVSAQANAAGGAGALPPAFVRGKPLLDRAAEQGDRGAESVRGGRGSLRERDARWLHLNDAPTV